MTQISQTHQYKLNTKFDECLALKLNEPTEVSDIVLEVKWDANEVNGPFRLMAYYFDENDKAEVSVNYVLPLYQLSFKLFSLSRQQSNTHKGKICSYLKFKCLNSTDDVSNSSDTGIKITAMKYDSDKVKEAAWDSYDKEINADMS